MVLISTFCIILSYPINFGIYCSLSRYYDLLIFLMNTQDHKASQ